ncbi:HAD family hydrolase [Rhabdochlamydiaceae symbiont of Dictyostelium giganteum]|uniref:HAD family hydrolase n=1 Tax=Rhabdochlamydiaceae symbiont of Dictyostelium giganteum TaxID=3342349 RepID=UPI00384C7235
MDWIHNFDLFLFDFDGLLVDTEPLHFKAYQMMCQNRGYSLPWTLETFCAISHSDGPNLRNSIYELFPSLQKEAPNWETLRKEKNQAYFELIKTVPLSLMPGVTPLLEKLSHHQKKRCVVTNSTLEQVSFIRKNNPILDLIPLWFTRETYQEAKPSPDGYLKALQTLRQEGDRVIGFEDSLKGYEALKQANIKTPLLICPSNHPQLELTKAKGALHFSDFFAIPLHFCN